SLDINPGELFFLLGPSGCGKTTLLRMIAGFIEPSGGSILFDGRDVTHVAPNKRNTGMVFQSYALWPHMTVAGNVAFGLEIRRVGKETGITAVYVTHDQKEALSMADRVAVIDRGRTVQTGPPEELYRKPASRFVAEFLGETNFIPGRLGGRTAGGLEIDTP